MNKIMRALIVEDDKKWQKWLGALLAKLGFMVDLEDSPNPRLHPIDGTYTLALIDVSLLPTHKDQLGVKVSRKLKQESPETFVILLSAFIGSESAMAEVLSNGMADEVIIKDQLDSNDDVGESNLLIETLRNWKIPIQEAEFLGGRAESAWKQAALARRQTKRAEHHGLPAILLVEDKNGWVTHISNLVERAGAYTEHVKTYQHAMNMMQTKSFLVAIVDLHLSSIDLEKNEGLMFIRDTIQKYPDTKFIVISGFLDETTKQELFKLGVFYVEDKLRFDEYQYQFFEVLKHEVNNHIPAEANQWYSIITEFIKANKRNKDLNKTAFAKHPYFENSNWPGDAAYKWIKKLVAEKISDKNLNSEKHFLMEIIQFYYFNEEETITWPMLAKKLHCSESKVKHAHPLALDELAKLVYQELQRVQSKK